MITQGFGTYGSIITQGFFGFWGTGLSLPPSPIVEVEFEEARLRIIEIITNQLQTSIALNSFITKQDLCYTVDKYQSKLDALDLAIKRLEQQACYLQQVAKKKSQN